MFSWRRRKNTDRHGDKGQKQKELEIPSHFLCPITLDLMNDPVTLSSGITYDRESINTWLEDGNFTCPVTNQVLRNFDQIPNHSLRIMIQDWCVENRNYGVERIPTPRIPVTSQEVSEILFGIMDSNRRLDQCGCLDSVRKIKKWGMESERNRRCIIANETAGVLAAAFDAFATDSFERNANLLEEILCVLNWMFPLAKEAQLYLGSQSSLHCMVWFLKCGDISVKQNSMNALQELLSCNQQYGEELAAINGVNEMLFKFIKDPICPSITKASLMVIFYMVSSSSSNEKIKSEFLEMDLVSLLLETIVESERSLCERALGVVDKLCDSKQGREAAYNDALAMPVLVKKILRVSELATEYSVSTIWKLSKYGKDHEERVLIEALQVGAFQKLLLLIQVGCGDETKEKATELLKLMNPYRAGLECIDSVDFKSLKRSF
ncbi:U-box domain-containing protein 21-like [Durio zibethinus]|uniref:U-box domain-containing protein n=1 Tax=Durio zibethinus TaxID=66656 RepID=A0A6P6BDR5_DURZI|nr:U-box domain-containing protein 21-like [Durio zibethinus]